MYSDDDYSPCEDCNVVCDLVEAQMCCSYCLYINNYVEPNCKNCIKERDW